MPLRTDIPIRPAKFLTHPIPGSQVTPAAPKIAIVDVNMMMMMMGVVIGASKNLRDKHGSEHRQRRDRYSFDVEWFEFTKLECYFWVPV